MRKIILFIVFAVMLCCISYFAYKFFILHESTHVSVNSLLIALIGAFLIAFVKSRHNVGKVASSFGAVIAVVLMIVGAP